MGKKRSLIPNIFTMGNMIMGFFAIIFASRGGTESLAVAGVLIFIAGIFDASDGAVARALDVESEIGGQLDSLSDGVSYGIAPAVIAYRYCLYKLPEIGMGLDVGMLVAMIFPICAIYRLARFNISDEHAGFNGLPSPPAGVIISSIPSLAVISLPLTGISNFIFPIELFVPFYIFIALMMVSNVSYGKTYYTLIKMGKTVTIITTLLVVFLLFYLKMWAVFLSASLYILAGLIRYLLSFADKSSR